MARRIRSITTGTIVRKQCATVRKSDEPRINAQHGTLQNVTGPTTAAWQEFLRTTPLNESRARPVYTAKNRVSTRESYDQESIYVLCLRRMPLRASQSLA